MPFQIEELAAECRVADPEEFVRNMRELRSFLEEANTHVNLTRLTSERDFFIKHVYDSLAAAKYFPVLAEERLDVADIGCGGGFPSLVLAMAYPKLRIRAIDSTGKKIRFVAAAAEKFHLKNLVAVQGRSNELNLKREYFMKYDVVTARAVSAAPLLVASTDNFLRRGGFYLLYKTPEQAAEDLPVLEKMGGRWERSEVFFLPEGEGERCFVSGSLAKPARPGDASGPCGKGS